MRTWQTKTDDTAPAAGGILTAAEDNVRGTELNNAVTTASISLDPLAGPDADQTMLAQAMARYASGGVFGTGGGTANAQTVTKVGSFVPPKTYFQNMIIAWTVPVKNTGAATLNPFALGVKTVYDELGNALTGGELADVAMGYYDTALSGGAGGIRLFPWGNALNRAKRVVGGTLTLWVRTDGSDANDGSANSSAKAFATISGALAYAAGYNLSGKMFHVRLGNAGTYAMPSALDQSVYSGMALKITGDTAAQASYILSGTGCNVGKIALTIEGVTLTNTANNTPNLQAYSGASVDINNVTSNLTGGGTSQHFVSGSGSSISINAGCIIQGGGFSALNGSQGANILVNAVVTVSGTPAFSRAFALFAICAIYRSSGAMFSGAATGTRYEGTNNAVIATNGAGANLFPGSVAGTTATGAQYN